MNMGYNAHLAIFKIKNVESCFYDVVSFPITLQYYVVSRNRSIFHFSVSPPVQSTATPVNSPGESYRFFTTLRYQREQMVRIIYPHKPLFLLHC